MKYVYIGIRSLTYAQRAAKLLESKGLPAAVVRAPLRAGEQGCAYSVRFKEPQLNAALSILRGANIETGKIYRQTEDGTVGEMKP